MTRRTPRRGGKKPSGDEVGYKKPPRATRFKPGQSGNPSGRRRKAETAQEKDVVAEVLNQEITITIDGRPTTVTLDQAALMQLAAKAAQGDRAAIDTLDRIRERRERRKAEKEGDERIKVDFNVEGLTSVTLDVLLALGIIEGRRCSPQFVHRWAVDQALKRLDRPLTAAQWAMVQKAMQPPSRARRISQKWPKGRPGLRRLGGTPESYEVLGDFERVVIGLLVQAGHAIQAPKASAQGASAGDRVVLSEVNRRFALQSLLQAAVPLIPPRHPDAQLRVELERWLKLL